MQDHIVYGTYPLRGAALEAAVRHAVEAGFRAFDTAQIYGNEADLGTALRRTGLPRDRFRVTTKIAPPNFSERDFLPSLRRSLDSMELDYADTVLAHFPVADQEIPALMRWLAEARDAGLARAVGISNFTPAQMHLAAAAAPVPLALNQIEFHPLLDGAALLRASANTGIALQAFSPLARGAVFAQANGAALLADIARAHGKTPAQVVLRWILQQGLGVVTQSARPAHIDANLASAGFDLSADEMRRIGQLRRRDLRLIGRRSIAWAPAWD
ncbi:aldo/keto reductase [Cupriavidus sp. 30B13]|uniref:aldo/keto reductase n=1 Tax=Cupriavidus sp. 30B13 TaxID=3384241 RepID=UPI003B921AB9